MGEAVKRRSSNPTTNLSPLSYKDYTFKPRRCPLGATSAFELFWGVGGRWGEVGVVMGEGEKEER